MENEKVIKLIAVADTPESQEQGLQFAKGLPSNSGVLFKFQNPRVLSFWMKNTYIPLDIAFIDHRHKVASIERLVPLSLRSVSSGRPCLMALEVSAGTLRRLGIEPGMRASLSQDSKSIKFETEA